MCGILFCARWDSRKEGEGDDRLDGLLEDLKVANTRRGPDAQNTHSVLLSTGVAQDAKRELKLEFFASELRLRGDEPVVQPHVDDKGDVLCWNGEIFDGLDVNIHENDGAKLFKAITELGNVDDLPKLFGSVEGPYAFTYYHSTTNRLFFARDPLGRRSLLIHKPTNETSYFVLASVSVGQNDGYMMQEVGTEGVYVLDMKKLATCADPVTEFENCVDCLPRISLDADSASNPPLYAEPAKVNTTMPPSDNDFPPPTDIFTSTPEYLTSAVDDLISHLEESVRLRVCSVPQRGAMSSSLGLHNESVESPDGLANGFSAPKPARIAVLFSGGIDSTMLACLAHRHIPLDEPIDLLNVAFENPRKIQLKVEGNIGGFTKQEKKKAKKRLAQQTNGSDDPSVEVGGRAVWEVENGKYDHDYLVPDRVTGLQEVEELRRVCRGRTWNFVEVDVPYKESKAARPTIEALMWPSKTVMDLSLAMALYFAARGKGQIRSHPDAQPVTYTSPARVLLNGLGSDELLGGYGRHRTAYMHGGWKAVIDELQLEIDRIPTRNLGRDDRTISTHGKETRHPFLSLNLVRFLAQLPVHYKVDPRLDLGVGDKLLLRLAARKVGIVEASERKKRAMQFGSHSARMEAGLGNVGGRAQIG